MGKFDPNSLPEGTEIVIETDMIPVIAAINAADDIPDQAIQGGVCLAMCLKWVESGARNLDFWETLTQDETLNDIRWLHHRERAMRREMARVVGLRLPPSGVYEQEGLGEAVKERYRSGQLTEEQQTRRKQVNLKNEAWFGKAVQERTGLKLDQETSFSNRDQVEGVAWDIATGPVGYYVLSIDGKEGHAIAVHEGSDGKVHLMDSNYGELRFPSMMAFVEYLPHHLQEYEGNPSFGEIRKCALSAFAVGGDMNLPDEPARKRLRRVFPNVFPSELRRHGFLKERPLDKIIPADLVENE